MSQFLSADQIEKYYQDGFLILEKFFPVKLVQKLLNDIEAMLAAIAEQRGINTASILDQGLMEIRKVDNDAAIAFYQAAPRLMSLKSITSLDIVRQVARELMGSNALFVSAESLRYDPPLEDDFLIKWHQDYTFIQDSENSIVFWFPLRKIEQNGGGVQILPKSHLEGIRIVKAYEPFSAGKARWVDLCDPINEDDAIIAPPLDAGDVLLMNTLLVHRSWPNRSNKVRWTGQFRVGDFMHENAIRRLWPSGATKGVDFSVHHSEFVVEE